MILYIDVKYNDNNKSWKAVGGIFESFTDESANYLSLSSEDIDDIEFEDYVPGQFYKRELPIIKAFLEYFHLTPDILIVDGYINLKHNDGSITRGLGGHARELILVDDIIGIAKSSFCQTDDISELVYRGVSKNSLRVQSASGKSYKNEIECMVGKFRIPTILKNVDHLTKHSSL